MRETFKNFMNFGEIQEMLSGRIKNVALMQKCIHVKFLDLVNLKL